MPDSVMEELAKQSGGTLYSPNATGGYDVTKTEKPEDKKPEETEKPEDKKPEETKKEPTVDEFSILSKRLGQEFKDEETFNTWKSSLTDLTEKSTKYDEVNQRLSQLEAENNELKAGVDPMQFFPTEDDYKYMQLKKLYPDFNPSVLSEAMYSNLGKMSPDDVVKLNYRLNDSDIYETDQDITDAWVKDFGYNPDVPFAEQERNVQKAIQKAAKKAKTEIETLKANIKLPEKVNVQKITEDKQKEITERQSRIKELAKPDFDKMLDQLDKVDFTVEVNKDGKVSEETLFSFEVGEKFKKRAEKEIKEAFEYTFKNALEWNKEIAKKVSETVVSKLKNDYVSHNRGVILQAYKEKLEKEFADKYHVEVHNPTPLRDTTAPKEKPKAEEAKTKFQQAMDAHLKH